MRPLELPISAATSRTVVAARPLRRATARAASMIASRRRSADMRAIAGTLAHIAQASNSGTMPGTPACSGVTHGHGRGEATSMIRTTPFHERTSALNETGLWEHWSNSLVAQRYQMSEKFEYFAIRNSAGMFDTSPLYKYRIAGPDAERFLGGVLARDPHMLAVGHAHYTLWCDDRGFVIEDGVLLHVGDHEYLLTAAEPNLAYFEGLTGHLDVTIEDVTEDWGILSVQGPYARDLLAAVAPVTKDLGYFGVTLTKVAGVPVLVSRTGYTGDLGY